MTASSKRGEVFLANGVDRVRVTVAGAESVTAELLRSSLPDPNALDKVFFVMAPGQYTNTSQAFQGSSVLLKAFPRMF